VVVESIDSQLRVADAELKELAKKDETCALLMSMPGVGPVTAVRFVSAIDDPNRFDEAHQVGSYLGLTPSENTTGFKTKRGGITKAGAPRLRWTLIQGAWCLYRTQPNDPMVQWAMAIERRAGRKKAVTALARKMACVLWTMWKRNERYAPPPRVVTEHESN
jgi:transposase